MIRHIVKIIYLHRTFIGVFAALIIFCTQPAIFASDIYVSQTTGADSADTAGTETSPFKSITYAMITMKDRGTPDPWVVHIKAGTYDSDPAKADSKEVFPISLRQGMTIQGDDGADNCVISGAFDKNSKVALLKGDNITGITLKNLTLTQMNNVLNLSTSGSAAELPNCAGVIQGCVVSKNAYNSIYLTVADGGRFDMFGNIFRGNGYSYGFRVGSAFIGDISGNTFIENSTGFYVSKSFTGDISGNTFSGNRDGGFYINGGLSGNVSDNIFSKNNSSGFRIDGKIIGDISGNTFSRNTAYAAGAFYVISEMIGNISGNTFIGNSSYDGYGGFCIISRITGNISGNTFSGNFGGLWGGGGFFSNDIIGNISGNIFSNNGTMGNGGGFFSNDIIGNISGNIFSNNSVRYYDTPRYGGGFYANSVRGYISKNVFSRNSGAYGGGLYIASPGGDNAIVSDNFFLYTTGQDTSTIKFGGTDLHSNQNLTMVNNTFYGSDEAAATIGKDAPNSVIMNNIFVNVPTPIREESELDLIIADNDFHGATDILNRNSQPLGNDPGYIAVLLTGFRNNQTWEPGLVGENIDEQSVWSADAVYDPACNQTIFTDSAKSRTPGRWKNAMVRFITGTGEFQQFPIADNTATQVMVMGDLTYSGLGAKGYKYTIDDYHLAGNSRNIDAGAVLSSVSTDFDGQPRPAGADYDIGADEFSDAPVTPFALLPLICIDVDDSLALNIPCVGYQGNNYKFTLNYSEVADDPSGLYLYWKADISTFENAETVEGRCLSAGDDLKINIPCADFRGKTYAFTLNYAFGRYWKADVSTLRNAETCQ